jgi:hypothetical protein
MTEIGLDPIFSWFWSQQGLVAIGFVQRTKPVLKAVEDCCDADEKDSKQQHGNKTCRRGDSFKILNNLVDLTG